MVLKIIMKKNCTFIIVLLFLSLPFMSVAQQDAMFTQSFDNMLYVNPAYAGSRGMVNFTDLNRVQWVGFDGNPRSNAISMNAPIFRESLGAGLNFVGDQVGPIKQTMFFADLSYSVKVNKNGGKLAFGLKAGFNIININTANLLVVNPNDPSLEQNTQNRLNLNFGSGIYYHSPKWYIGVSSPKILEQSMDGNSVLNKERRHYFGILGGVISVSEDWKLKPAAQIRATVGAPLSIDLSTAAIFRNKIWFGGLYRFNAAAGMFFQFQFSPQLKIGIASEFDTSELRKYNTGSYELLLSYDLNFKKEGVRSPRYF
jgi:type IX secretion system PorP/SprF family membrane protein